jgi:hypothetical protein
MEMPPAPASSGYGGVKKGREWKGRDPTDMGSRSPHNAGVELQM